MSYGILKFKLPEEQDEFDMAQNGVLYSIILENLSNKLRSMSKYEDKDVISIEELREFLGEQMNEYNVRW